MKKSLILILFFITIKVSFAQWNILDTNHLISAIWLNQPNDGWTFGKDFRHWDGTNWTTVIQDSAFGAGACAFPTANDGWVFGYQDSVYRYNGNVWTKQYLGFSVTGPCSFYDSNHGWIIGLNSVYKYLNGTWTQYTNQLPTYLSNNGCIFYTIAAVNTNTAMVGGYSVYPGPGFIDSAYILNIAANPWTIDTVISEIRLTAISFSNQNQGWILGMESNNIYDKLFKYNGSGWVYEETFSGHSDVVGLYMYSNSLGWLSRGSGIVYNYDGFSWTAQDTLYSVVQQFSFSDPLNGWALISNTPHPTDHSWLYQTTTGGIGKVEYLFSNSSRIKISPNPATTTLTIEGLTQKTTAEVYDISGKLLFSKPLGTNTIDISSLGKGLYFIKLSTAEGRVVRKFVKE
jgi:hypothetical protein